MCLVSEIKFRVKSVCLLKELYGVLGSLRIRRDFESIYRFFTEKIQSPILFYKFITCFGDRLNYSSDKEEERSLARFYLEVLLPICEKFRFPEIRHSFDDYCFRIVNPRQYQEIAAVLKNYQNHSKEILRDICDVLGQLLNKNGYDFKIESRFKHIYSISRKTDKKNLKNALRVHDIFGARIILERNRTDECFDVLNLLHEHFYFAPGYLKDYISSPKANGYQSLHTNLTGVVDRLDLPVEVQIRTRAMHEYSESGSAAHWLYEKNKLSFKHSVA